MKRLCLLLSLLLLLTGCGKPTPPPSPPAPPAPLSETVTVDTYAADVFARDLVAEYVAAAGLE